MMTEGPQGLAEEWVSFPGGELEGQRPRAMCAECREALTRAVKSPSDLDRPTRRRPIGFPCYGAERDGERARAAAGNVDTGSDARFQYQLPFEPVNRLRLDSLKAARRDARASATALVGGPSANRRRHAQIEARHAL